MDVWGLDEELLFTVPQPVVALLFLFPITKEVSSIQFARSQDKNTILAERSTHSKKKSCHVERGGASRLNFGTEERGKT